LFELKREQLREVYAFTNAEAHAPQQDLESDKPGRSFDSHGQGRHAMEPRQEARDGSRQRFVSFLTEALVREHSKDPLDELVVAAPPHLLGMLRQSVRKKFHGVSLYFLNKALLSSSCTRIREEVRRARKPHLR
jgi:protein required for attachment to host cells